MNRKSVMEKQFKYKYIISGDIIYGVTFIFFRFQLNKFLKRKSFLGAIITLKKHSKMNFVLHENILIKFSLTVNHLHDFQKYRVVHN